VKVASDPQYSQFSQSEPAFARAAMESMNGGARAALVNRTHRVVRERAKALQERRNRDRSLMLPLFICSVLLLLSAFAVWSGLYQYQGGDTVQAAEASNDHFLVVLLWFVPVFLALLATVWVRRSRSSDDEAH
jgi:H+/Cl- antiporter ClcA